MLGLNIVDVFLPNVRCATYRLYICSIGSISQLLKPRFSMSWQNIHSLYVLIQASWPFHCDSCDILTNNNILSVPNLYNNYSGPEKL